MNSIPQEQNTEKQLERLAAQRQLYSDAKALQLISLVISVPLVVAWSILVAIFPKMLVYAGLWGISVTFLELFVLSQLQKSAQEKAAKIQQLFDCEVLQFNWSSLNCGIRIEPETIIDASTRFRRKNSNYSTLQNWYPVNVGQLPIHQARIICQRSNIWWDAQLRLRYAKWIIIILITLTIIVFIIGLIGGLTLEKFLSAVVVPLTPAFVFGSRQRTEHKEAATRLNRLRENAETLLQEVINRRFTSQDFERESYTLQSQIYDNRRRSPLIFDWLYSRLRRKDEEQMNRAAEALIQELNKTP
ncbi:MAG: hypothetical protein F6K58_20285 [Symploca sp. SIO2E9]|nr:hypothetical protein [Symploca sp. SIO2E9]